MDPGPPKGGPYPTHRRRQGALHATSRRGHLHRRSKGVLAPTASGELSHRPASPSNR
jgi:hypothetical protein